MAIRPRLFLEGNFFLDVTPGSPSSPHISSGDTLPASHTSTAVQLDEVLTALQSPDRENLQLLLEGFGTALTYQPTAADDLTQDPDVQGQTAAEALNDSFLYGGPAGRDTAIVSEALLGRDPHDLSDLIAAQRVVFGVLAQREAQLQELIVNFDVTLGAFAAEATNLSATIRELAPTLEEAKPALVALNGVFPPLRASALALEPKPARAAGNNRRRLPVAEPGGRPRPGRRAGRDRGAASHGGAGPGAGREREPAPVRRADAGQPLHLAGARAHWGRDHRRRWRRLPDHERSAQLARALLHAGRVLRREPGIRRQRLDGPLPAGWRPHPGGDAEPRWGLQDTKLFAHTIEPPQGTRPLLPNTLPPKRTDVDCYRNAVPNLNAAPVGTPLPQAVSP